MFQIYVMFHIYVRFHISVMFHVCMYIYMGFPGGSAGKESACNAGDLGLIPGLGRSPAEGKGYPLRYSALENSMDCIIRGVAKSQTGLSDFHLKGFREISSLEADWLVSNNPYKVFATLSETRFYL